MFYKFVKFPDHCAGVVAEAGWLLGDCGAQHQLCSDGRTCCELGDTCCPDPTTNTGTGCCDIDNVRSSAV